MTRIVLSEWDDGEDPTEEFDTTGLPDVIEIGVHDLPMISSDPHRYCGLLVSGEQPTDPVSRMLIGSVLAAVCSEPAGVLDSGGVHDRYARRMLRDLDDGRDTPLAAAGGLAAYARLTDSGRREVSRQVTETMVEFAEAFPSPADINVIATDEPVIIDWGEDILSARIPALAQTTGGIVGIAAVPLGSSYGSCDAGAMASGLATIPGMSVSSVHVWDAENCTRYRADEADAVVSARVMLDVARSAGRAGRGR